MAIRLRLTAWWALTLAWGAGCGPEAPRSAPAPRASAALASPSAAPAGQGANPWLATFRERARRDPNDGDVLYNLAALCDQADAPDEALAWLRQLDAIGWAFPPRDEHFRRLNGRPEYRALAASFTARAPRVQRGRVAFTVPEPDLIPEGIAHDARDGSFFVSSIAKRKIVRVDARGRATDFVPSGRDGLGGVLGLHVDGARRLLWAVSNPLPMKDGQGTTALFAFDLDTGALRHTLTPPAAGEAGFMNDVALGPRGEIFASATGSGTVYVADGPAGPLRPLFAPDTLSGPNGLAFCEEAGVLLVAHDVGLAAVDAKTGGVRDVQKAPGQAIGSFDGIALRGRTLVGVQNGLGAPRVVRVELDGQAKAVTSLRVLEAMSPALELPTTGVLVGDSFYVVANSQLRTLGADGRVKAGAALRDPAVLAVPLGG
jgi:sugar lactone lactonase YvrE